MTAQVEFNPVKVDQEGKKAMRVIWSTKAINQALIGLDQGRKLVANPFYENNSKILKADLVFQRTPEEIEDFKKCANDVLYFAKKCHLMTPEGIKPVVLREYQEDYLKHLVKNRLSLFLSCRQSGKTVTSAIFLLWYVLFNVDKNALVLGNKGRTAKEILNKIKNIFYSLPYYLKPGVLKWNEMEIAFDNGCLVNAETTTPRSGISFTYHCVLADEFAHIDKNILDEFYNNLFPVVTAGKANFIISSTQNGFNLFQRLYAGAVSGENDYKPFKVDWYQVPEWNPDTHTWESRDEKWHQRQIANYGSEEAFNQQFGTSFDSNANSLISNRRLKEVSLTAEEWLPKYLPGCEEHFTWKPDFEPTTDLRKNKIIITIDLAEGRGGDYTTFIFNKVIPIDESHAKYEALGMFHSNETPLEDCAKILKFICSNYMDMYNYYISIEMNTYGDLFRTYLMKLINEDSSTVHRFNEDSLLKITKTRTVNGKIKTEYTIGVRLDSKEKLYGCLEFKSQFEQGNIINTCSLFINELYNFTDVTGNNTYRAAYGHDDIVMTQMQIVFFSKSSVFKNFLSEELQTTTNYYNTHDIIDNYGEYSSYTDIYSPTSTDSIYNF